MGEFDHIPAHAALAPEVQRAHERIMDHLTAAAKEMERAQGCDTVEAWLRLAAVTKSSYERISGLTST